MATKRTKQESVSNTLQTLKPVRVCFSFAAYAKNLIDQLQNSNLQITKGLTDAEFSSIESTFRFTFPPDLRSILREGLPVDSGFPNWRSSSTQQLQILIDLPILYLCRQVSRRKFWVDSWGIRPFDDDEAVDLAKGLLRNAPVLVPIYRHFYIPASPFLAGNPVFYVNGDEIRVWSFDVSGFFQQVEFSGNGEFSKRPTSLSNLFNAPAWAATEAREIPFWTELGERKGEAREDTRGWWSGELGGCLEEVYGRLKEGGWKEDDVREMMMMDGCDEKSSWSSTSSTSAVDIDDRSSSVNSTCMKDEVELHVRLLSETLLRAGWSSEDVMDLLGFEDDHGGDLNWVDFNKKEHFSVNNTRLVKV
ncbi:uncharacterized protein LOC141718974 [Apium graveolens]|uniref:uncharacterized protein LOC141718974 n=1 Tax=Apium graveolens TaxID=4045 RepID=UPI003D79EF0D